MFTDSALGPQKMAVVTVQFPDAQHNSNVFDTQKVFQILNDYCILNSYGKMWWEISISPTWYTLHKNQSYYGPNPFTTGDLAGNGWEFVLDSLSTASKDFNFSQYSKVILVYAKWGQKSAEWTYPLSSWNIENKMLDLAVAVVSDSLGNTIKTIEHECGHLLGLPDLYYQSDGNIFEIIWDGMGGGVGMDGNATMFCSWTKLMLGWIENENVETAHAGFGENVTIDPLGQQQAGILVVRVPVNETFYYLIEVRERVGADSNLLLPSTVDRQAWSGVFVLEVNEELGAGVVKWVNPKTQQPSRNIIEVNSAAFQVGENFSNPNFGIMIVKSKSGSSYQVMLNRTHIPAPATDINSDGVVDILDVTIVAIAYGSKPGEKKWNPIADLDKNGEINILDVFAVVWDFGKTV